MKKILPIILVVVLVFNFFIVQAATPQPDIKKVLTVTEIAKKSNAVVLINVYDKDNKIFATGSGFFISDDGKLITNYHVIEGAYYTEAVTSDKKKYIISGIVNYSIERDIAVLKINASTKFPFITMSDSDKIQLGENIVVIGSPLGLQNTVSTGIISSVRVNLFRKVPATKDIQITSPLSHGSSGGVLLNMYGEAIGVTYAGIQDGENLNFAIPINEIKLFLTPQLISFKMLTGNSTSSSNNNIIETYVFVLDEYSDLKSLALKLDTTFSDVWVTYLMTQKRENKSGIDSCNNRLISLINNYNDQIKYIEKIKLAIDKSIDTSKFDIILSKLNDCINSYKNSIQGLYSYNISTTNDNYKIFADNASAAFKSSGEIVELIDKEYQNTFDKIIKK